MAGFDVNGFWAAEASDHQETAVKTFASLQKDFSRLLDLCITCVQGGGKILFFGNGGSAADAQHLATELTIRYVMDRKPIAAIALTTDSSTLTAGGNDLGFDHIFSRQVEALGRPADLAIGISTSGHSQNILLALQKAQEMGLKTAGLSGRDGGKMPDVCDVLLVVPSNITARIQEMHITLGHMLCGALEQKLGLV